MYGKKGMNKMDKKMMDMKMKSKSKSKKKKMGKKK
jgi:hypothetical protein